MFTEGSANEYLSLIGQFDQTNLSMEAAQTMQVVETMRPPHRDLRPEVLAPILKAARERKRIEVEYCSLYQTTPEARVIQPHTIVFNGQRWHTRAWCEKRSRYSDFVLSRIADEPEITLTGSHGPEGDEAWNTILTLEIGPDPRLKPLQCAMIERDYGMQQ